MCDYVRKDYIMKKSAEKKKRIVLAVICIVMIITALNTGGVFFGKLSSNVKAAVNIAALKDGKYTGSAEGFRGKIKTEVTIKNGKIVDIKILSASSETPSYLKEAKAVIPKMIEKQTYDVDAVSGATYSSNGIKKSVKNALNTNSPAPASPAKVVIKSAKNSAKGTVTVKWNKIQGVNGYKIRYVQGSSSKTVKAKASATSIKINNLKKGKTYKVSVRAYKTSGGKNYYGSWSKVLSVKIKK